MAETIYQKILEKGTQVVNEIKTKADEEIVALEKQLLDEYKDKAQQMVNENKKKNDNLYKTKITDIVQEVKQNSLRKEKQLINEVFNESLKTLQNINDSQLEMFVKKSCAKSSVSEGIIRVDSSEYKRYAVLFSTKPNEKEVKLDKLGKGFTLSSSENINGGFIIECEHYDIDNTYHTVLSSLIDRKETEISEKLFSLRGKK